MFESLRARLDRLFREHTHADPRAAAADLRAAVLETKVALSALRDALAASERELAAERRQLEDAERRGRLAADVGDQETVTVALQFTERHRARIALLERKVLVQRDEVVLATRDLEELSARVRSRPAEAAAAGLEAAWRDLEAAGGVRPQTDLEGDLLRAEAERKLHEQAVEAQLAHLKRKLGKQP